MKILTIYGSRPQAIKVKAMSKLDTILCNTGQHYDTDMSSEFFGVSPHYNLGVVSEGAKQIGEMIIKLDEVLRKEKPDLVLVYGDTNSTLAGALASAKRGIPIGHIEAGLRSGDKTMQEEQNRIVVDHLSTLLFCPTKGSVENLKKEGIVQGVHLTGDVLAEMIKGVRIEGDYTLATIHRAENVDNKKRLSKIIKDLKREEKVIFPVHPRTRKRIKEFGIDTTGLELRKPVSYEEMIDLERKAKLIITDSGGVQREAYLLGVPCKVMRDNTEWHELTKEGVLGENASEKIARIINEL